MSEQTEAATTAPVVTIGGKDYPLAVLGLPEVGQLRVWAKAQQPDPVAAVKPHLAGMEPAVQRVMVDNALAEVRRPVTFGSPEFSDAMQTGEGLREVLWLSLKRAGANIDRAAADAAADAMTMDRALDVFATAFGQA